MKPLSEFNSSSVRYLFTDIDDTLTDHGQLHAKPYEAMWRLAESGIAVIPVTGRPAGWCEMIARFWPVHGVVGENGGFYFRYHNREMRREFANSPADRKTHRNKLEIISKEVLENVSGTAIASDQFSRLMDLAIDFAEDVDPLSEQKVDQIVEIFHRHGAQAKVSSIHVNGWFGDYDKLSMCRRYALNELNLDLGAETTTPSPTAAPALTQFAFSGDSPNDEPMFAFFTHSFAVANIKTFLPRLRHRPAFVSKHSGGQGFIEIAETLLAHSATADTKNT